MNNNQKKILSGVLTAVMILVVFFLRQAVFQNFFGTDAGGTDNESVVILETSEADEQGSSQEAKPEQTAKPDQTAEPDQTAKPEKTAKPDQTVTPDQTAKPDQTTEPSETAQPLKFRSKKLLNQHYEKHGIEMGFDSAADYEAAAAAVVANPDALHKIEKEDGDDVYYLEETNEFVIVSKDGYLRTYFLPDAGIKYYNKQ